MKIKYNSFSIYMLLIIGTAIFSCDFINPLFDDNGSLAINCIINKTSLDKPSEVTSSQDIKQIRCIIYKDGSIKKNFFLTTDGNKFKGSVKLKKGTYDIKVELYDESGFLAYIGSKSGVEVCPLKTTKIIIDPVPSDVNLTISVSPSSNAGSISKSPDKTIYSYGETVKLTATPSPGYQFDHWDGVLSGSSNPANIILNGDKSVTAVFIPPETISTPNTPTGPSSGTVGQSLSFSTGGSTSNLGHPIQYQFDWGDGSSSSWGSSSQSHTYSNVGTYNIKAQARCQTHTSVLSSWSSAKTVTISGHTLTVSITPAGSGTVTKNPSKSSYNHNEIVQLTASSAANYNFSQWTGDLSGSNNPASITMNGSKSITAVFSLDPIISGYVKDTAGNPISSVTLTFSDNVGTTTTNSSGYYIKTVPRGWSGTVTPSNGSSTFSPPYISYNNVTTDQTNQNFTINEYISTPNTPTGPSSGTVGQSLTFSTGGSTSNLGHPIQYQFDWGDGSPKTWGSSTQSHIYSTVGTYNIKAQARCQTHTNILSSWSSAKTVTIAGHALSVSISPAGSGMVTKNPNKSSYNHNETVQLSASPAANYIFNHWEGDLSSNANPSSITMTGNISVTAVFIPLDLLAYYPFNGNANDGSGNGNHGTVNGATLTSDRFGNSNEAYYFDGNGDHINCGDGATLKISGDITVCAWVNLQANSHGQVILNKYNRTENKGWLLEITSDGRAIFNGRPGYGGEETSQSGLSSQSVFDYNWCFLVGQRQGANWKIFVNGVLSSQRIGSNEDFSNATKLHIGVQSDRPTDPAAFSQGIIDDVRIYGYALSETEIQKHYTEGGWPHLVAFYPFNGNANDESGNGNHGTVSGATLTTDRFGNNSKAFYFDGVDDLINCGHKSSLQLTNALTISVWFSSNISNVLGEYIIGKCDRATPSYEYCICWDYYTGGSTWGLKACVGGENYDEIGSNYVPPDNDWQHVVVTFTYPGQLKIYLDGIDLGIGKSASGLIEPTLQDMVIGCIRSSGEPSMRYFSGKIDDIKIYNCVLSPSEIQALYHEGGW